ncbi:transglycosylase SLT domain-containing protein [Streptomyces sp. NBC_00083]|uniref:transglycosylase SLT domain-containing protein n=1 Tax=Streptomyces sp. NBC_00083 TaxID=2975647 RepID=UPI00225461B2|nr:transglycosylase SLT domain-containing protein [Streptomyces sp. NBC_00083]MCX5388247.1 transglycosylase SLT domain-containing protein [Streptomyces sp. NBC_00083]
MAERHRRGGRARWMVLPAAALAGWGCAHYLGWSSDAGSPSPTPSHPASVAASAPPSPTPSAPGGAYDPAAYAPQVRTYAEKAGVSAQLLMAILYNEDYKPHDPAFERSWQKYKPDAAFGIANMHRAAFDQTKRGRDFASRSWQELPDDRALAVEAAAWYLHDMSKQLPAHWAGSYSREELMALGYNAGGGNMAAFARGVKPGSQAADYLARLRGNWDKAAKAVARTG